MKAAPHAYYDLEENMITRRNFMHTAALLSGGLLTRPVAAASAVEGKSGWFMPDEADSHQRTWMAFGASQKIWGAKLLPEVQRNLATIARTISKYEPVSMLVRESDRRLAEKLVGPKVELIVAPLDDLWMRDTGPVFVLNEQGQKAAIDFNFNGWGEKQAHAQDAEVAAFVAEHARVEVMHTELILEGGGIEVDGHGTAIIAESCVLNANRNPDFTKAQAEVELKKLLGLEKIIWLPGIKGKDITDGHTDFYARFARPGVVVAGYDSDPNSYDHAVTKKHLELLKSAKDAHGKPFEVITLTAPKTVRKTWETEEFASGYIGFYVCNGAVIAQEFGDAQADLAVKKAFPEREVVQINIDGITGGGGSIHCATQQEPKV